MEAVILVGLIAVGGWVLGIVGFFRAGRARRDVLELRALLAASGTVAAASTPPPWMPPVPAASEPAAPPPEVAAPPDPDAAHALGAEALPVAEPALVRRDTRDLETLLTTRLGVWLGAAALLFAGIFLVRYAVDHEMVGPGARCALAALLGIGLLIGAEWLQRHDAPGFAGALGRDQAPAGLAAGGIGLLFAAAYGAGPFYGLLPGTLAFVAMAAASLFGLAAALQFGQLTAAIGVAGAFVTPALVATDTPFLPGLFGYLLLVSAAALLIVRHTAWTWLGWATAIAGAVWVSIAAVSAAPDEWAAAAFVAAAAALHLGLLPAAALDHPIGRRLAWVPFAALGASGLFLEALVPDTAPRLALFLLSPIAVGKGIAEPRFDRLPWLAVPFGLLALLLWELPEWNPTGEAVTVAGVVQAVLPGAWAPQAIRPLIGAAALFAAFHAATGAWLERRAPHAERWAALLGAVPVLTLAVAYAQIERFQPASDWAAVALVLTVGLTGAAALAARAGAPRRAGIHAAGAVAALALGAAMLLQDHWLTLAIAFVLPALAWIEARADLRPLRWVALAAAGVVLARLLLNWYVADYDFGETRLANGLLAAYAAPAALFGSAAVLFRRRGDDLLVATLEAGTVAFLACFLALEIRHWSGGGQLETPFSFGELAVHLLTLAIQASVYLHLAQRTGRPILHWAWRILGGIALGYGCVLLLLNPAWNSEAAGAASLAAAYLLPAALALHASRRVPRRAMRRILAVYALVAGFAWITLQVREIFHPAEMSLDLVPVDDAELWAYSGAWLGYGIALMAFGIRTDLPVLRLTALAVVGLAAAKVFLFDMAGLAGMWRVLSFLGLGLTLIGLGSVHRRFVRPAKSTE